MGYFDKCIAERKVVWYMVHFSVLKIHLFRVNKLYIVTIVNFVALCKMFFSSKLAGQKLIGSEPSPLILKHPRKQTNQSWQSCGYKQNYTCPGTVNWTPLNAKCNVTVRPPFIARVRKTGF